MWKIDEIITWMYRALGVEEYAKGERFPGESNEGAPNVLSLKSIPKLVTNMRK